MVLVKIIEAEASSELERKINEFIKNPCIKVISIKYSTALLEAGERIFYTCSALLYYEDKTDVL